MHPEASTSSVKGSRARRGPIARLRAAYADWRENASFLREYLWMYRRYVGVGILTLIVVDVLEIVPPILLMRAVDVTVENGPTRLLVWIALGYAGVAILQGLCRYGWRMYLIRSSLFAGRDMRGRFARHLFGLPTSFFDRTPVGELMSLATSDVEAVRMMLGAGVLIAADAFFYFLSVPVAMVLLSPELTLLAFAPLPIIPWLVLRNERQVHARFEKVQGSFAGLSAMAQESLTGVRVLKGFAREDAQTERFRQKGEQHAALALRLARVQTSFGPTLDFTMSLGMVLLLFVGGRMMMGPGADGASVGAGAAAISLGTFVAFQRYIQKMVWPMAAVGMAVSYYQRAISSSRRLKTVLAETSDVPEAAQPRLPALVHGKTAGAVELRNLSFGYPGSGRLALRDVSLRIEPGERVAFVGAVGAGKSALLQLLPRLYPVGPGMILIDGVDVNEWPIEELRRQVGFVSQDVFLFSETVTENVAFGLHRWMEHSGTGQALSIEEATQLAAVHDDVMGLTSSYKTRLGERGINLSGGQKQRLTIARAIAKSPSILVLDDALSSVDVQTEERILGGLRARPGRNTEIISAHRISTIKDADRIVVLEQGCVRQMGTHAQLLVDRRGLYRKFYEQQRLQEDLEAYAEKLDAAAAVTAGTVGGSGEASGAPANADAAEAPTPAPEVPTR